MPRSRRVLATTSAYHLTNDATVTVLAAAFPILRGPLGLDYNDIGLVTGTALLITVFGQLATGFLADGRDVTTFLPLGIAILGIGSLAIPFARDVVGLIVLVSISRIGASFYHPVGISWVAREFAGPDLDHAMGFQSSFGDAGVILGMAATGILAVWLGWPSPFLLWGGLNLLAVAIGIAVTRGHRSPRTIDPEPVDGANLLRGVLPWLFPLAVGGAIFTILTTFGPLLFVDRLGTETWAAPLYVGLWIAVGTVAAFLFGRLSRAFGRFRILVASYLALTIAGVVAATLSFGPVLLVFVTLGATLFLTYPALFSFVSESAERRVHGASFGIIFAFQLIGGALAGYGAGALAQAANDITLPFWMAAGLAIACGLYILVLRPDRRARVRIVTAAVPGPWM